MDHGQKRKHLDIDILDQKTLLVHAFDIGKWPKLFFSQTHFVKPVLEVYSQ